MGNPPILGPRKKFMCLISWERTQKRDPHRVFRGDFGGQKRGPKRAIFGHKSLVYCFFVSNFLGIPGISLRKSGISRQKVWFPWVSKDIPNFLVPTPSRGKTPPYPKISGPRSLGLGSFLSPERQKLTN